MSTQVAVIKKNYARTAHVFQLLSVVALVAAGVYGYLQYQVLTVAQNALSVAQAKVAPLQSSADKTTAAFGELKSQADTGAEDTINKIENVYPSDQNYTALTMKLDEFFKANDKPDNRIFQNSLSFGSPIIDAKNEFAVLPFTMSILTTREKLETFIRYVDSSGDLEGDVRLMDIRSISMSLPQEAEETTEAPVAGSEDLTVSLSMNSYFQKPTAGVPTAQ
jgi:hypothetical protein